MTGFLEPFLERMQRVSALGELNGEISGLRDTLGVEHIVYHSVNSTGEQYAALTYSAEWVGRYIDQDYARIDPVVQGCFRRFQPVNWKQLDWSGRPARSLLGEAIEAGVGNQGLSLPVRGPSGQFALFTVNHSCRDETWAAFTAEHARDLILASHFVNLKALELERGSDVISANTLSPREIDALTLLAKGLNRAQAADYLAISEHTLRAYLESARHKMGAMNTTHAVVRALSIGLIVV
jgi:DNA-binding CsgD family transcriptional regulator